MIINTNSLAKVVKDPLLHFLGIGATLFLILSLVKPPIIENQIHVNRDVLLTFIQYRSKAFEPNTAAEILDAMDDTQRTQLVDDYLREEALYREAQKLGLDEGDYVIRMRMVQKMEFMTASAAVPDTPDKVALEAWYEENKQHYAQHASATFAHIYFSTKNKTVPSARAQATNLKAKLIRNNEPFESATQFGERFLFHTNYVDRTYDYVKSQFGKDATDFIHSPETPLSSWVGPITSIHGVHLIYVSKRTPAYIPALTEITTRVKTDMARQKNSDATNDLINSIIKSYSPTIDLETHLPEAEPEPIQ